MDDSGGKGEGGNLNDCFNLMTQGVWNIETTQLVFSVMSPTLHLLSVSASFIYLTVNFTQT